MNFRFHAGRAAVVAAAVASSMALATPATTMATGSAHGATHLRTQLRYSFERGETLRPGTVVHDVSRHRHAGRVRVAFGGHLHVVPGIAGRGRGASYPSHCRRCSGKAVIEARDRRGLDPQRHVLLFGVAVKVTRFEARGDSNLVQKGLFHEVGGQYKLQMQNGVPSCVVFGHRGRLIVEGQDSVADGTWHRIDCRRTRDAVTLRVDGSAVGTENGHTGQIANGAPVTVGGRSLGRDSDQYHGDLDNVFIRIKR